MFTEQDTACIRAHGLTPEAVERQLENFRRGFPFLKVVRAAAPGDGILVPAPQEVAAAVRRYDEAAARLGIVKFVPASGAATRMFKELFAFVEEGRRSEGIDCLLLNIERFAFWPELRATLPAGADDRTVVEHIIGKGLGYGGRPKGLVTFHAYAEGARKAAEEHLVEGAQYAAAGGRVRIHFTVSPEHRADFEALMAEKVPLYERRFGVHYDIAFSEQKPSTDTVAVNPDNTLFRTDAGALLFRPAGHGALIENLNEIDADLIFVKNIDNVTTDARRGDTVTYKKVLAGLLLELQERSFEYIRALDTGGAELADIARFIRERLCVKLPDDYNSAVLRAVLDRPIRLCGMVRNEGPLLGGQRRRHRIAPNRRVEPDRTRRPAAHAAGHPLQSGRSGLRRAQREGREIRPAAVYRSADGFHLVEILRRPRAAGAGVAGVVERRDGTLEHRFRRRPRHDVLACESRPRPAAAAASISVRAGVSGNGPQHAAARCRFPAIENGRGLFKKRPMLFKK